ncbi:choice-of-anchor A family protein [Melioribacteraceae bacterium 4301-Me]|uniref:choice-of-anchor A family protein n=1 Tax=Pyranulibacter aquaticus TaxID=3163344 RepID=UPI003597B343
MKQHLNNVFMLVLLSAFLVVLSSTKAQIKSGAKKVTDYTSIAQVSGTADGINVTYKNPYTNNNQTSYAGTFKGTLNGNAEKFYCIDLQHNLEYNKDYWDEGQTPPEMTYILNNYFPYKNSYPGKLTDNNKEAAAVQLAIWHFSDGLDANTITDNTIKSRALAIISDADTNYNTHEFLQTLLIIPPSQSWPQGSPASFDVYATDVNGNPIANLQVQLSTTLGTLSASTVTTDANGHAGPITLSYNGVGTATIKAKADVEIPQGTRYVHKTNPDGKQKLVLATPSFDTKEVTATVEWYTPQSCDTKGFTTFTQGGWGSPSNSSPGKIRDMYFSTVFPNGLTVGGTKTLKLTSATAVKNFLPQGGTPNKLTSNYVDVTSTSAGVLAGQIVALTLNVQFDAAGYIGTNSTNLGDLYIIGGPFAGMTVNQFLVIANQVLGGDLSTYSYSDVNDVAAAINENFDNGTVDNGYLTCGPTIVQTIVTDLCATNKNSVNYPVAKLYTNYLSNGNINFRLELEKTLNDNTYGTGAIGWPGGHTFNQLKGSDQAEFKLYDANNNPVLDFVIDYIESGQPTPSGYGSYIKSGNSPYILYQNTSLSKNFNDFGYVLTTNSPSTDNNYTPNPNYPNWIFDMIYEATVSSSAFGSAGFGKVEVVGMHNSPNKLNFDNLIVPEICSPCKNKIGDFIWHDTNVNGIQDSNEPGIPGVIVELLDSNNNIIATDTTDSNGHYEFSNLDNGTYKVRVASSNFSSGGVLESTANTKWYSTKKNQGNDDSKDSDANIGESVTVSLNCADNTTIDFGFYKTCISIIKTSDKSDYNKSDVITYTFTIENCGDIQFHGGVDVYDAMLNPNGDHKIKHIDVLDAGQSTSFTMTYTPGSNDCGELVNNVTAVGHPVDGSADVTAQSSATVHVNCGEVCATDWSVEIGPDSAICEYDSKYITITGKVHLTPNPSIAYLQTSWRIVEPNDGSVDNSTHYATVKITKDTVFTITALWPGIRPSDQVVEIHYGVNILDCNGNPIKDGAGRDLYWYPWVCPPPQDKHADLKIEKTVDNEHPQCGENTTFTIKVTNNGPDEAKGVQVTDLLPTGLNYVSSNASQGTYDPNTGLWMVGDLASGAYATLTITINVDCSQLGNSTFDFGVAKDFNLFVIEDATSPSADTQGKVAVGRDANFSNYSIGDQLPPNSGDVLIVGRNLTYTSGAVYNGNVVYGNSTNLPQSSVSISGGTLRQDSPINFAAAKVYLENLSTTLAGYTANGTVSYQYGGLSLTGTDPFLNVFAVSGANLSSANNIQINVPNGSVALVNVSGTTISISGGMNVSGATNQNVLFNFNEATSITIQGIDFRGSILAPFAAVNFISGVQNGQMICKSLNGPGQFNYTPFIGNIPPEKELTNIARITANLTDDPNPNNNTASATITITQVQNNNGNGNNNNGNQWQQIGSFSSEEIVYAIAYDANGNIYAGTWGGKIYKSTDGGHSWNLINPNMHVGFIWSLKVVGSYIFAATEQGLFKFDGSNWILTGFAGIDVHAVTADASNTIYVGTYGTGVYFSNDLGATWNAINNGLGYNLTIQALTVTSNSHLFAATVGGGLFKYNGSVWTHLNINYNFVWALAATSTDVLLAGTYGDGLYISHDGGNTWSKSTSLSAQFIYSISVDASNNIYVSSWASGVYSSSDMGATWTSLGMYGFGVSTLVVNPANGNVYAGTKGGQVFMMASANTTTSVNDYVDVIPTKFELNQNYPNPFNPSTTIRFAIPEAGQYTLKIYNIIGQEIATLVKGQLMPGIHKVTFDAGNFASGIYIYKLSGQNVNITRKMILMK